MENINTKVELDNIIENNDMVLVYFGSDNCNVCLSLRPKTKELLKKYPSIKTVMINIDNHLELSSHYGIFTIPVIILFIQGKETIREARIISLDKLDEKISRYYNLFFEDKP